MKKKAIGIIIGVILLGGCVNSMSNNSTTSTVSTTSNTVTTESAPVSENIIVEEEKPVSNLTVSQENCIKKAESYLRYSSFSKQGLIEQLEYEGFTIEESTFAVDSLNIDWNEQAALKAQSYLDYSSFSRQGLIDQLIFEGFTTEQANHGVAAVGF